MVRRQLQINLQSNLPESNGDWVLAMGLVTMPQALAELVCLTLTALLKLTPAS